MSYNHQPHHHTLLSACLRALCVFCLAALPAASVHAAEAPTEQAYYEDQNLQIVFIDHEPSLPTADVIRYLRETRRDALEYVNSVIFYMPSDKTPFVSLVNLGKNDDPRATEDAFDRLCAALNQPSHNKDAFHDRQAFMELVNEFHVFNDDYSLGYRAVQMNFYLTREFWTLGYNETILSPIYFALNVPKITTTDFLFNVYASYDAVQTLDKTKPFGERNFDDINKNVEVFEFDF